MILTTFGVLANAEPALIRLAEVRLPFKVSYVVGKLIRAVAAEMSYYHTQREVLVRQYGEPQGDQIVVSPANMSAFVTDITGLGAVTVTLTVAPLDLSTLATIDITPGDLLTLLPLSAEEDHHAQSETS